MTMTMRPRSVLPLLEQVHVSVQSLGFSSSDLLDGNLFEKGSVMAMVTDKEALASTDRSTYAGGKSARRNRTVSTKPIPSFKQVADDHQNTPSPSGVIGRTGKREKINVCIEQRYACSNGSLPPSKVSSLPALKCTKGTVPAVQGTTRKKGAKHTVWTMTQLPALGGVRGQTAAETNAEVNSIDARSIYGKRSKIPYVNEGLPREDTVALSPLTISRRREQAGADDNVLPRKRPDAKDVAAGMLTRRIGDSVTSLNARPASVRENRPHEAQSLFAAGGFWQSHRPPVSSSQSLEHGVTTAHYCDVLGRRFCHRCTEWAKRAEAQFVGRPRGSNIPPALASTSPTMCSDTDRELSFIGVKKVIITKAVNAT